MRETIVVITDDLDRQKGINSTATEVLDLVIDGIMYRLDLSKENYVKVRGMIDPLIDAAQKCGRVSMPGSTQNPGSKRPASSNDPDAKAQREAIRDWARRNGHAINGNGKIRAEIVAAFNAAHGGINPPDGI